ncbi:MAG: hypothetical protein ACRDPH_15575 [Marmoricola sp.]
MTQFGDRSQRALDALVVLGTLAVLGVLGGLVWNALVTLPVFRRTSHGAVLGQVQLAGFIGIDGWFVVIALVAGLVAGALLMYFRPGDPLLTVVLLLAGGGLASWLMVQVGLLVGPDDPAAVLKHLTAGHTAAVQLHPHAAGVELVWPLAALIGGVVVLLGTGPDAGYRRRPGPDAASGPGSPG